MTLQDIRPGGQIYKMLVDLETGQVRPAAEIFNQGPASETQRNKLQPNLVERLQALEDDDRLTVMIWVAAPAGESATDFEQETFEMLAAKYPEAALSMERTGIPFAMADRELARRIRAEYFALLKAEMRDRVQPVVTDLEQRGFTVHIFEGMPQACCPHLE